MLPLESVAGRTVTTSTNALSSIFRPCMVVCKLLIFLSYSVQILLLSESPVATRSVAHEGWNDPGLRHTNESHSIEELFIT
jgi:hypothetical protein